MSDQVNRAQRIQSVMQHPGWADVVAMLDEQAADAKDALWALMADKPDTLSDKAALKYAIRAKALIDFKESLTDELKILLPTKTRGGA